MKGVVLAGGLGTRLGPMTTVVNKHVLDLFDEPMIHFPIRSLARAGVTDLVVVVGRHGDQIRDLLGDGSNLGVTIAYAHQDGEAGIADALQQARDQVGEGPLVVILGDQVYQDDLTPYIKQVEDARSFGVASIDGDRVSAIAEKPARPATDLAVTGCYMYDGRVFEFVAGPAARVASPSALSSPMTA